MPGVADTYQGTEIPDFSLVDPDNRRPVDYRCRQTLLKNIRRRAESPSTNLEAYARELTGGIEDGRAKLYLTWRALHTRGDHPGLFSKGEYFPLTAAGPLSEHVVAFARRWEGQTAIVAVPRLTARLNSNADQPSLGPELWKNTHLETKELGSPSKWMNVLTNSRLTTKDDGFEVGELFTHFPVALLLQ